MSDRASKALAEASLPGEPQTYDPDQNTAESLCLPFIVVRMGINYRGPLKGAVRSLETLIIFLQSLVRQERTTYQTSLEAV